MTDKNQLKPLKETETIWHKRKAAQEAALRTDPLDLDKSDPMDTPVEANIESQSTIDPIDTPFEAAIANKRKQTSVEEDEAPERKFNPTPTPWGTTR